MPSAEIGKPSRTAFAYIQFNAVREGLPISAEGIKVNMDRKLGEPEADHKFEVGPMRNIHDTDLVHSSVLFDKGSFRFPHNNPKAELRRVDDDFGATAAAAGGGAGR